MYLNQEATKLKDIKFPPVPEQSTWKMPQWQTENKIINEEYIKAIQNQIQSGDLALEGYVAISKTLVTSKHELLPLNKLLPGT